jgi:hypothetical protein
LKLKQKKLFHLGVLSAKTKNSPPEKQEIVPMCGRKVKSEEGVLDPRVKDAPSNFKAVISDKKACKHCQKYAAIYGEGYRKGWNDGRIATLTEIVGAQQRAQSKGGSGIVLPGDPGFKLDDS